MENTHNNQKLHPAFFFLSLGTIAALITSVTSFLSLVFEALNKEYPDVLNAQYQYGYASYSYDSMRGALATLIIAFPIFLTLSYFWKKIAQKGLGRVDEIIRKWMIYLMLFLASIACAIDLIMLVRYFVSGEITTRFALKVVMVLITAGMVGVYYVFELRAQGIKSRAGLAFSVLASVLVLGAIVYSFMVMGSPATQRALRLDEKRVQDLQSIQWQVISFWQQKQKLPKELSDLVNPISGYSLPVDPEVEKGMKYEYIPTGAMSFQVCATFAKPMPKGWQENGGYGVVPMPMMEDGTATSSRPYSGGVNESWDHEAGRTCYDRTIDKDLYPPYGKPAIQ